MSNLDLLLIPDFDVKEIVYAVMMRRYACRISVEITRSTFQQSVCDDSTSTVIFTPTTIYSDDGLLQFDIGSFIKALRP
jgi:environmental stress-induced protein Ves